MNNRRPQGGVSSKIKGQVQWSYRQSIRIISTEGIFDNQLWGTPSQPPALVGARCLCQMILLWYFLASLNSQPKFLKTMKTMKPFVCWAYFCIKMGLALSCV